MLPMQQPSVCGDAGPTAGPVLGREVLGPGFRLPVLSPLLNRNDHTYRADTLNRLRHRRFDAERHSTSYSLLISSIYVPRPEVGSSHITNRLSGKRSTTRPT